MKNIRCKATISVASSMGGIKNVGIDLIIIPEMLQFVRTAVKGQEGDDPDKAVVCIGGQMFLTDLDFEDLHAKLDNAHLGLKE